ncbi:acetyl-CoA carboxylase [Agrobacterium tumefaciens]|uniref:acetyl-CoA carboxylase n=1 Tax=Agrobacterium tumefaciens TaxID=358 RepID=UPI000DD3F9B7|nr:acetyl-CoA carboxylase [Agrobacterium tumefaciens]
MSRPDFSDPVLLTALTDMLTDAGVDGVEITTPEGQVRIIVSASARSAISVAGTVCSPKAAVSKVVVKAPITGLFCSSKPALPAKTQNLPRLVAADDVIGFIRIDHILVPVVAGRNGSLVNQLAVQDALVGFGDPLFEIELQS